MHQNRVFGQIYKILIFRIYVESQFPPTAVNAAIEECLAEMDQYLRFTWKLKNVSVQHKKPLNVWKLLRLGYKMPSQMRHFNCKNTLNTHSVN